jgi:hypothetical protein
MLPRARGARREATLPSRITGYVDTRMQTATPASRGQSYADCGGGCRLPLLRHRRRHPRRSYRKREEQSVCGKEVARWEL